MTAVSIFARRDAFRTKGRSDDGPGASVEPSPRMGDAKDVPLGDDDHARFTRLVLPHFGDVRWRVGSPATGLTPKMWCRTRACARSEPSAE